jgi:hypothetical protein
MNKEEEINDIINKIEKLQLEQNELIGRLRALRNDETSTKNEKSTSKETNTARGTTGKEQFPIGTAVIIKNPGKHQEKQGIVAKYNNTRILSDAKIGVRTSDGTIIWRAPKNLRKVIELDT